MAYKWILKLIVMFVIINIFRFVDFFTIKQKFNDILANRLIAINTNLLNVYSPMLAWMVEDILVAHAKESNLDVFQNRFYNSYNTTFSYFQSKEYIVKFDKLMIKDDTFESFYQKIIYNETCSVLTTRALNCEEFPIVQNALKNAYKKPFFNLLILYSFIKELIPEPQKLKNALDDEGFMIYAKSNIDSILGYFNKIIRDI